MTVDRTRRRFVMGGAALAATIVAGSRGIAQDRPSRRITVYKEPT